MDVTQRSSRTSRSGRFIWIAVVMGTGPWLLGAIFGFTSTDVVPAFRLLVIGGVHAVTTSLLALAYTRVWVAVTPPQAALAGLAFTLPLVPVVPYVVAGVGLFLLAIALFWIVAFAVRIREGVGIFGGLLSLVSGFALGVLCLAVA